MGRHVLAGSRRKSPLILVAWVVPTALLLAVGGASYSLDADRAAVDAQSGAHTVAACCMEIVAAPPSPLESSAPSDVQLVASSTGGETVSASRASRWRPSAAQHRPSRRRATTSCEGSERLGSIGAEVFAPGINAFNDLIAEWRAKGDLDGMLLGQ